MADNRVKLGYIEIIPATIGSSHKGRNHDTRYYLSGGASLPARIALHDLSLDVCGQTPRTQDRGTLALFAKPAPGTRQRVQPGATRVIPFGITVTQAFFEEKRSVRMTAQDSPQRKAGEGRRHFGQQK